MTQKHINLIVILAIAVILVFMGLGLFGLGGFPLGKELVGENQESQAASPEVALQQLLQEVQTTGTVADLRIVDVVQGTGDGVQTGDTVTVHYTGVLPDGTVFDSSVARGTPFPFTVGAGGVIQGWELGLLGMQVGGRRILAIPPTLGYGANENGPIPANSTLLFEVELLNIVPAGTPAGSAQ
jgi:FKBP-type peptidyl-prolyl cis-trans isomerase